MIPHHHPPAAEEIYMIPMSSRSRYPIIMALIFSVGVGTVIIRFLSQARVENDALIADHIGELKDIFIGINESCKITGFRYPKEQIDFLNVISFAGSVVGSMNLLEPEQWKGPYLKENLTIAGKEYEIVATKKGYFIVPGDGVKLANGKIVGKTLPITSDSDIEAMMRDPQALLSKNGPLAAHLSTFKDDTSESPASSSVRRDLSVEETGSLD